ncbi:hypothetical protein OGAPHI_005780 [Ogataea philodendri]|uniref:Uncharacterized protein n=1 Tax=Ogataea philodendri TaxID=1378263 RepID=A0A9P8NYF5_9ASCO|nr:uncharacterized protein OGAPHI_005780 [Ogataea philodendri]KAH3662528.1 hypothetical protein OGAPHI_005780 [Ogataea philodendri]
MSSTAFKGSPRRKISVTVRAASDNVLKFTMATTSFSGCTATFKVASTMMPKVPSLPTNSPVRFSCHPIPGSTTTSRSSSCSSTTLLMRLTSMHTPRLVGMKWPSIEVPPEYGIMGILYLEQIFTTATTSSTDSGNTTRSGRSCSDGLWKFDELSEWTLLSPSEEEVWSGRSSRPISPTATSRSPPLTYTGDRDRSCSAVVAPLGNTSGGGYFLKYS